MRRRAHPRLLLMLPLSFHCTLVCMRTLPLTTKQTRPPTNAHPRTLQDPEFANDPAMWKVEEITLSYTFFESKDADGLVPGQMMPRPPDAPPSLRSGD